MPTNPGYAHFNCILEPPFQILDPPLPPFSSSFSLFSLSPLLLDRLFLPFFLSPSSSLILPPPLLPPPLLPPPFFHLSHSRSHLSFLIFFLFCFSLLPFAPFSPSSFLFHWYSPPFSLLFPCFLYVDRPLPSNLKLFLDN